MYQIIGGRSTGKTSQLLLLAKKHGAILVCSNPRAMEYKAQAYGITGIKCISYYDFYNHDYPDNANFLIDELCNFITEQITPNVIGFSLSEED